MKIVLMVNGVLMDSASQKIIAAALMLIAGVECALKNSALSA